MLYRAWKLLKDRVTALEALGQIDLTGLTASVAELNRAADLTGRIVAVTDATLAVDPALHEGRIVVLNKADGQTITLPAATGSGARYEFIIGTLITSVGTLFSVTGDDFIYGQAFGTDSEGEPGNAWGTVNGTDNEINLDGSTTGGAIGDRIILTDFAADAWGVEMYIQQSGTEATPFDAAA